MEGNGVVAKQLFFDKCVWISLIIVILFIELLLYRRHVMCRTLCTLLTAICVQW